MRSRLGFRLAIPCVAALIALLGCGDSDPLLSGQQPGATPTSPPSPAPLPSPSPSASPAPIPLQEWTYIFQQESTDAISPEMCRMPFEFELWNDGHYHHGPCPPDNLRHTGNLTPAELAELRQRANSVARSDLEQRLCEDVFGFSGGWLELGLPGQRSFRVYERGVEGTCYRGSRAAVESLLSYVQELNNRYYLGAHPPSGIGNGTDTAAGGTSSPSPSPN